MGWVWFLESSLVWGYLCYTKQLDIKLTSVEIKLMCVYNLLFLYILLPFLVKDIPKLFDIIL